MEFTLVTVLLVTLFLAVLQLALVLYVRNTLVASTAEAARYAANADREPGDGARLARELIGDTLGVDIVQEVTVGTEVVAGVPTVVVEVRATFPMIGLLGPDRRLVVRGHAFDEDRA